MTTLTEIQEAIRTLPEDEFEKFSLWFDEYEEQHWDRRIERDQQSGPLHDLMEKARTDFTAGKCNRL